MSAVNPVCEIQGGDFLIAGSPVPKYKGKVLELPACGTWTTEQLQADYLKDCEHMTRGQLRKKYKLTYDSWRNMKQRAKMGAIIHQSFKDFVSFLKLVGPRLYADYTLDRIDNSDPEYAPGKAAWHDKQAQNSNKGNNVVLTDNDGVSHTVSQWAEIIGESEGTLRKRLKAGWTAHEAIHGKAPGAPFPATASLPYGPWADSPWPVGDETELEAMYGDTFSDGSNYYEDCGDAHVSREEFLYAKVLEAHHAAHTDWYCHAQTLGRLHVAKAGQTPLGQPVLLPAAMVLELERLQLKQAMLDSLRNNAALHLKFGEKRKAFFASKFLSKSEKRKFYLANQRPARFCFPPELPSNYFQGGKQSDLLPSPFSDSGTLEPGASAPPAAQEGQEFFHGELLQLEEVSQ